MITAKDIIESRAFADMAQALRTNLHDQFTLAEPDNVQNLVMLRLRWDALHSIIAALGQLATEAPNGR